MFPIDRRCDRELAADWAGDVFVCDIDRTYLETRLSSWRSMALIPFEFAVDKIVVDGMNTLLQEIRRGPTNVSRHTPLFFVSASPAQLRGVIEQKMLLDGLEFDGITFKDWVGVVRRRRMRRFREQVGFKLTALLSNRAEFPCGARETLIGDDWESDPLIFALYADIVAGRLRGAALLRTLERHGVESGDAAAIAGLKSQVADCDGVKRAYVRLDRDRQPSRLKAFAPRLVGCLGALQMAAALCQDGAISQQGVVRVGQALRALGYSAEELGERFSDALNRALLWTPLAEPLSELLVEQQIVVSPSGGFAAACSRPGQPSSVFWTPEEHLAL